jgi:glycosyltransferase involved in cell wall biosynthesis
MLESQGFSVDVVFWGSRHDGESPVHKVWGGARDLLHVLKALQARPYSVLFVNTAHGFKPFLRDIPLLLCARGRGLRRILLLHGSQAERIAGRGNRAFKLASRLIATSADGILVLSRAELAVWREFEPRGSYARVVNPFVAASLDSLGIRRPERGTHSRRGESTILFVGRLLPEKGAMDLLAAMKRVNGARRCRLILAGTGPLAAALMAKTREWGLNERVDFKGYLDEVALNEAYASADVFVLPTYWNEGFPTVIAEAMSVGLPIVTTRIRGSADLLGEGENCLFAPPRNPVRLSDCILRLLDDEELSRRMSAANRRLVDSFRPEVVGAAYSAAFDQRRDHESRYGS